MPGDVFLGLQSKKGYLFVENNKVFNKEMGDTLYYLREMAKLCGKRKVDFVVCLVPDVVQVDGKLESYVQAAWPSRGNAKWNILQPNQVLAEKLRDSNITCFDLYPFISDGGAGNYRVNDIHWNLSGNIVAARSLYAELKPLLAGKTNN